ncbi:testis-expressed protein 47-like [Rhincodon typus]|uniref:testis-expressed protein 47-like n=1 Tax=Rhincodon typus TaxID=259920 RepID=UPI0020309B5C|nr:testis-expressed protein 47-like [Rhincodon typus]
MAHREEVVPRRGARILEVLLDGMEYWKGISEGVIVIVWDKEREFIVKTWVGVNIFEDEYYYEALFHKIHSQYQEMPVTGLLLMHSTHYIHLLESSIDVLYCIIRDLTNQSDEGLVQSDTKVLVLSHNIPDRLYRQWLQRPVNLPFTLMMDTSEMEPVDKLVTECLTLLLKLGIYIQQNPKKNITGPNHTVPEEIRHLIVKENTIKELCSSSELMTPQTFLECYEKSTYVILDSELIWPTPLHLFLGG